MDTSAVGEFGPHEPIARLEPPDSVWRRTAPTIEAGHTLRPRADVAIVGAGLSGLSLALMLLRAGHGVTVLEARKVGAVTTGNTTGKLSMLQGTVLSGIRENNDYDALRHYVAGNRAGQQWLENELAGSGAVETTDAVTYAVSTEGDARLQTERQAAQLAALPVEHLDDAGAKELGLPFDIAGALRLRGQAQLQPMLALARLASRVIALGGIIVEGCRVRGASLDGDGVTVATTLGECRAASVVLATGTPILDRGMFFAKLEPSRSLAAAYRLREARPPRGAFLSIDDPPRSLRTAADRDGSRLLVVGGPGFQAGHGRTVREIIAEMDAWTQAAFGIAERVTWWAAQDYRTFTNLPFAAALPRGGGRIYAMTGYAKWGMTNSVAAAIAVCGQLTASPLEWADAYGPHPGMHAAAEAVGANADVARQLAVGWARAGRDDDVAATEAGRVIRSGVSPVAESTIDGVTCRVSAVCTHLGGIVEWNDAERSWDCPLHGSRFSPTGAVLEGPATADLDRHNGGGDPDGPTTTRST